MICKLSRKDLKAEAERLDAERISRANIYDYENERGKLCGRDGEWDYDGIAYSAGTYGNIGRLDRLTNRKTGEERYIYWA